MSRTLNMLRDAADGYSTTFVLLLLSWFFLAGSTGYYANAYALGHWLTLATPLSMICLLLALFTAAYQHENLVLGVIIVTSTLLGHFVTSSLGYPGMHLSSLWYAVAGSAAGFWVLAKRNDWMYVRWAEAERFRRVSWCALFAAPAVILTVYGVSWIYLTAALATLIVILFATLSAYEDNRRVYAHSA